MRSLFVEQEIETWNQFNQPRMIKSTINSSITLNYQTRKRDIKKKLSKLKETIPNIREAAKAS